MKILDKIISEHYIHIIDDFYSDLDWLPQYLKEASFFKDEKDNYPGLTSRLNDEKVRVLHTRFETILDTRLKYNPLNGEIRSNMKDNSYRTFIHVDPFLIAVIYLSDPPTGLKPEESGTNFYTHKVMNKSRYEPSTYGKNLIQDKVLQRDTKDLGAWELCYTVPMKKNRAIIYDGRLFHSGPAKSWGESLEAGRLTQNFFFAFEV